MRDWNQVIITQVRLAMYVAAGSGKHLHEDRPSHGFILNDEKTVVVREGQKHCVTGIVVNERLSIPIEYKKKIRQEMYYCTKFGVKSHLDSNNNDESVDKYILQLLGRINYVLSVEPQNTQMLKYKFWLKKQQKTSY